MPGVFGAHGEERPEVGQRLEGEPVRWYGRFKLYLGLGPTRTLRRAYLRECQKEDAPGTKVPNGWLDMANRWNWRQRADTWDMVHLHEAVAATYNMQLAAREKRVAWIEEWMADVRDALKTADIANLTQDQAREHLSILVKAFEGGTSALRKEYEQEIKEEVSTEIPVTADDLSDWYKRLRIAAAEQEAAGWPILGQHRNGAEDQDGLDQGCTAGVGEGWQGDPGPGRHMLNRQAAGARPKVLVFLDAYQKDPYDFDLVQEAGLGHVRAWQRTSDKFAHALNRERTLEHGVEFLHMELASGDFGIQFVNGLRDGAWLQTRLRGVEVLVLGQHRDGEVPAYFEAVPHVLTIREGLDASTARVLKGVFWREIARGAPPPDALAAALAECPGRAAAYVRLHVREEAAA